MKTQNGTYELIEFIGSCIDCGTVRTQLKYALTRAVWSTGYAHPKDYLAPTGKPYDRDALYAEWLHRNPVAGRVVVREW